MREDRNADFDPVLVIASIVILAGAALWFLYQAGEPQTVWLVSLFK